MAFQARHRFIIQKINELLSINDEVYVESILNQEETFDTTNKFLRGSGPDVLFFFYQSADEVDEEGMSIPGDGQRVLFATSGLNHAIRSKGIYFLKTLEAGENGVSRKDLDLTLAYDGKLSYGVVDSDVLKSMESVMSILLLPPMNAKGADWGVCTSIESSDFLQNSAKFIEKVQEILKSLNTGLALRKMDRKIDIDTHNINLLINNDVAINHFAELLDDWCTQTENYLEDTDQTRFEHADVGPDTELDYWRRRLQRLASITEQLKTRDFKVVIMTLSALTKNIESHTTNDGDASPLMQHVFGLLRRWKQIDINITEATTEAKDNVKYLATLEKFIEPLYSATPDVIRDALPALMNGIKMIHTIARYYNTKERMTNLFRKITNQMINNCKNLINGKDAPDLIWEKDTDTLLRSMQSCLKLNESYQEQYRLTKDKLLTIPKGKQFEFPENIIFGKFDLFCRRIIKVIDLFSTIQQFSALSNNALEGVEPLIKRFNSIVSDFKNKKHVLLDISQSQFDRDFVEFNMHIADLEDALQQHINVSFEKITSIEDSLQLLKKFKKILQRESLKEDLESKFMVIFHNYGLELDAVEELYNQNKHDPPIPRNMPPVAGNISWARHLLHRIEAPMAQFETNQGVLGTKESKKIVKTYNKVARTLVAFEYLWYEAWCKGIENAKSGLLATLIVRHPKTGELYVNFDPEILQLIREAKCLNRISIEIPENARLVMLQEEKFKKYQNDLGYLLQEYERITSLILPVTKKLFIGILKDIDRKLAPGMTTLTWNSMNIDAYKHNVTSCLQKVEELIITINDIIDNIIEKNLKIVGKLMLVDLPKNASFSLDEFVTLQKKVVDSKVTLMEAKSVQIEQATEDAINLIKNFSSDYSTESPDNSDFLEFKKYYFKMMYNALLKCSKDSLTALKKRACSRGGTGFLYVDRPFFEVDVQLSVPSTVLSPSVDDIQNTLNRAAHAVLQGTKNVWQWDQSSLPEGTKKRSFFDLIGCDLEIVRVVLLLTGGIQGTKNQVQQYLTGFKRYDWLWKDDKEAMYRQFNSKNPQLEDFEREMKRFVDIENEVMTLPVVHNIGALSLHTQNLKLQLRNECRAWKVQFSGNLHAEAKVKLAALFEYINTTSVKLDTKVDSLHTLKYVMDVLKEIRERESVIEMELGPVLDMYDLLEKYLPSSGLLSKEEMDQRSILRNSWNKLADMAEEVTDGLVAVQSSFKLQLLKDIKTFANDVTEFRNEYISHGPMLPGIKPLDAVNALKRFKSEYEVRERQMEILAAGEDLFALKHAEHPDMGKTNKELILLDQLYSLYMEVVGTFNNYKEMLWSEATLQLSVMEEKVEAYNQRCMKLPKKLKEWNAYTELATLISDFQTLLPLLLNLSCEYMKPRHWSAIQMLLKIELPLDGEREFKLQKLMESKMVQFKDELEEIFESADKQLGIEKKLAEIQETWATRDFSIAPWNDRSFILTGISSVFEELEESILSLQTMATMRQSGPFTAILAARISQLNDVMEVCENWTKVQTLWLGLEGVFLGGDIAKQMPMEAKKFMKIDKDFEKIMIRAKETGNVVLSCTNDMLKSALPILYSGLEACQKSLEGYLEQKRSFFPRFYFVANSVLLQLLSQGGDPANVQPYYEKIFDSISKVAHEKNGKNGILSIISASGNAEEVIALKTIVQIEGNLENWLAVLEKEMQKSLKGLIATASTDCLSMPLRQFVDKYPAQVALLGIQFSWTFKCEEALAGCKTSKASMSTNNKAQMEILNELSSWCLTDLGNNMNRTKIETLVTIQVHQRDVFAEISRLYKERKVSDVQDFEWAKQARFYWRVKESDGKGPGSTIISICDVNFKYSYEYLGCKDRLVITPLTDRTYITLSQALNLHLGGAPSGPAGTGKTETVKDLGRSLGIYVVVVNCTNQQRFRDLGKIFKGLCQAGIWGCFDEFNRIELPVLSVVSQQVVAISNAHRQGSESFLFPGEEKEMRLLTSVGYFITMNPGYQGRQELPENLKSMFRFVAMMIPDREMILKVKLCSVGYTNFSSLAKKFNVLYKLCEEQLSKQKHYDFGLRNILSVLRTAGKIKRDNLAEEEELLLYRVLRDLNLSKFVASDVPIFLALLSDLFPSVNTSNVGGGSSDLKQAINEAINERKLINFPTWEKKIIQYYENLQVRHGIMIVGPAGSGKTEILNTASLAVQSLTGIVHKLVTMNPKAILEQQMFGETDKLSGEWVDGVFANMWAKYNDKSLKNNTWIVCDGPVDAIWIENLNTVLDDNKILTLANGDRIPMADSVKLNFEVEDLRNASPATVSRTGIIYVSSSDLGWRPIVDNWIEHRPESQKAPFALFIGKFIAGDDESIPAESRQDIFKVFDGSREALLPCSCRVGVINGMLNLLSSLLQECELSVSPSDLEEELERVFLFALAWAFGGLLEAVDRTKLDAWLRERSSQMPSSKPPTSEKPSTPSQGGGSAVSSPAKGKPAAAREKTPSKGNRSSKTELKTEATPAVASPSMKLPNEALNIFNYHIHSQSMEWVLWRVPEIEIKNPTHLTEWESILIPTINTVSSLYLFEQLSRINVPVLVTGASGTTKTSTVQIYLSQLKSDQMGSKYLSLCASTSAKNIQNAIENEVDKRGGRTFGPTGGKQLTFFMDDVSMPEPNVWGDQPPLELVRQLISTNYVAFLDNDKRGDFKQFEDMRYIAAMSQPVNGKNSIPARLCRLFFSLNMLPASLYTVDSIFGSMIRGRLNNEAKWNPEVVEGMGKAISATVSLWTSVKKNLLPTPTKFHYLFSLRDVSKILFGILRTPKESISSDVKFVSLWRHECERIICDRLSSAEDKTSFMKDLNNQTNKSFGKPLLDETIKLKAFWIHFLNSQKEDDKDDDDGNTVASNPVFTYEFVDSIDGVKPVVVKALANFNKNKPSFAMELVMFDDAVSHVSRITRVLSAPRSNLLAIGVGGSGKRSLIRLASYICGNDLFEIVINKAYNVNSFLEDMRFLIRKSGQIGQGVTFMISDNDVKNEVFLQYISDLLATGDIAGLFPKDEMAIMLSDVREIMFKEKGNDTEDTSKALKEFFTQRVRKNLHVALAFSPMDSKYVERARRFPAIFSECIIDWFLPWPHNALADVARAFLENFEPLKNNEKLRNNLIAHTSTSHGLILSNCEDYFNSVRRRVYHTPKSYLSYLDSYMKLYSAQLAHTVSLETNVNIGLKKLVQGAEDVEKLKIELVKKEKEAADATKTVNDMVTTLQLKSLDAKKESDSVSVIRDKCMVEATLITKEKNDCQEDLAKALPYLEQANEAVMSIKPENLVELKKLPKPADIVKLVFDCVLILKSLPLKQVIEMEMVLGIGKGKRNVPFFEDSYEITKTELFADANLLKSLFYFSKHEKDHINDETIELLAPYLDLDEFIPAVAKNASMALEGMCIWVRAMVSYTFASKVVKPKLEALAVAEAKLRDAQVILSEAEKKMNKCKAVLEKCQREFETQMAEKAELESTARNIRHKMTRASALIEGLAGERQRWSEDAKLFSDTKKKLIGNVAIGSAFLCYCGPFNQEKRVSILQALSSDAATRNIPFNANLDVTSLLIDAVSKESWKIEGLPSDPLSIQNGILVTKSSRYPLLIDPQGQGLTWIRNREKDNLPAFGITTLNAPNLREQVEFCVVEGKSIIISDIELELDTLLDPILDKHVINKGKNLYIKLGDKLIAYNNQFNLLLTTRIANPAFSPELQSKVTIVDFTVTQSGLEEQLLSTVIGIEQKELEEQLSQVMNEAALNTQSLLKLNDMLLERLSANQGNLLDDLELIDVLASTKEKANIVKEKLTKATETKKNIDEKREQFRPVATRGSVLYFCVVALSNINNMYQTSLSQFMSIFVRSLDDSEKSKVVITRVSNIADVLTYSLYRNINRGLFESHKMVFKLLMLLNILNTATLITSAEVSLFLKGGSTLDPKDVPVKKCTWLSDGAWLNALKLSQVVDELKDLPGELIHSEAQWKRWYNEAEPEKFPTPSYDNTFYSLGSRGTWLRFLLIRSLREDRTRIAANDVIALFIRMNDLPVLGPKFIEPVTDTFESILDDSDVSTPVIYFVSAGADPTESIELYTRKKKIIMHTVSMGEGQEVIARSTLDSSFISGHWVLLQNCHLDLAFMKTLEELLQKNVKGRHQEFKLFLTTEPVNNFPIGLLQIAIKVTNEPPSGLRAGMVRNFTIVVTQDRLEKIESQLWRSLITSICFMHTAVQERRKYGPLGFCLPYEFSNSDLQVSLAFLQTHLYGGNISWQALQYIIGEVHYGGKITDSMDRRIFNIYTSLWINAATANIDFRFNPNLLTSSTSVGEFMYTIPQGQSDILIYRDHFGAMPPNDNPEIFGLHANADISVRIQEVSHIFSTLLLTQPKTSTSSSSGPVLSREEEVLKKSQELLEKVPTVIPANAIENAASLLGGLTSPLLIFLSQEVISMNKIVHVVTTSLQNLVSAIKGEIVMTKRLNEALHSLYDAKVPSDWMRNSATGEIISWLSPSLGLWFSLLIDRDAQYKSWIENGPPKSFWLTGFFNPSGFLTAVKQDVTRAHAKDKWCLDDVVLHTEVTECDGPDQIRTAPKEGVFIHGLFIEGAAWSKSKSSVVESAPKIIYSPMPVIYVTGTTSSSKKAKAIEDYGPNGPFECAVYKYPARTDQHLIFMCSLPTFEKPSYTWILRGVVLLCSTAQ